MTTITANPSARIIADHLRAATFIIGDPRGVGPSNVDQGYVVRKLIRRAIRHGRKLGITENFTDKIAETVIATFGESYPELAENQDRIISELRTEEEKFSRTLERGEREIEKSVAKNETIDGARAFYFFETFGFPLEMTEEILREHGVELTDRNGFVVAEAEHADRSRAGATQKFAGGLADHSAETTKLHTAAHLLLAGLREVLSDQISQKGSNITAERLRFDFSHGEKMTDEQKSAVEKFVRDAIAADAEISVAEMSPDDAIKSGATGAFAEKYGDVVKVFTIKDASGKIWSSEICGGPHVTRTGELGNFKIKKEESSSAGVRRVKAVLE